MDRIKSKWDFLLQNRPDIRGVVGNAKLIGGGISHNINNEMIFDFITKKGTFSYNERTDEFRSKLQIRYDKVEELKSEGATEFGIAFKL